MKQYQIHCNFTGAFPLDYPFNFDEISDARLVIEHLNALRGAIKDWKGLKPFQIWDSQQEKFVI